MPVAAEDGEEEAADTVAEESAAAEGDAEEVAGGDGMETSAAADEEVEDEATVMAVQACPVPIYYMGEFKVVASPEGKAGAITLQPTAPLTEEQIKQLQDNNASWVLYEVMPADDHETFAGLNAAQMQALMPPDGFRDQAAYESLIQEYVRDGGVATDQDDPGRKLMQVKFAKAESVDVDVEVTGDAGQPLEEAEFDVSGRTLNPSLQQGEQSSFQAGDVATLDFAVAQDLVNQGKATPIATLYSRRLRDYARLNQALTATNEQLALELDLAQKDLGKVQETLAKQQDELTFQLDRQAKYTADRDGLAKELKVLGAYQGAAEAKMKELREELSRLYRTNRQLVNSVSPR
jgi:hypothetical protein